MRRVNPSNNQVLVWIAGMFVLAALACNLPTAASDPPTETPAPVDTPTEAPLAEATETTAVAAPNTETPAVEPTPIDERFAVILVSEDDVLNVRSGAGVENDIVATLNPHASDISSTGERERVGDSMWLEVNAPDGGRGWVNGRFLTVQVPSDVFCDDPRVRTLLANFVDAIRARDGDAFAALVSPKSGLRVRHTAWNPEVVFAAPGNLGGIFTQEIAHNWGGHFASGEPIRGSFAEVILPGLDDALQGDFTRHCNTLEQGVATGGAAALIEIPFEYRNLNYVAYYRAGAAGDELNWRTWAVGVEYVRGDPFVVFLVQYQWEP